MKVSETLYNMAQSNLAPAQWTDDFVIETPCTAAALWICSNGQAAADRQES